MAETLEIKRDKAWHIFDDNASTYSSSSMPNSIIFRWSSLNNVDKYIKYCDESYRELLEELLSKIREHSVKYEGNYIIAERTLLKIYEAFGYLPMEEDND